MCKQLDKESASVCDRGMSDPFALNLAAACSLFPSISHVCREIGLNRQQFNKYLTGRVRPSRHNMRRICDFFGATESEFLLEQGRFNDLMSVRRTPRRDVPAGEYTAAIERLARVSDDLERYVGSYYRYYYSFSYPGKIMRSFGVLTSRAGRYYWKNIEREHEAQGARGVSKYEGMAFMLGERITIIEYETLLASSVTQIMLYPSYHSSVDYLIGLQTGNPTKRGRMPSASTVLLDYLGRNVDWRRALTRCGAFDPTDLDRRIQELVQNDIRPGEWVFQIEQL